MAVPLAIVYGGGGPFATAYGTGVAQGLREHGVPLDTTPALGTSGGAWAAAAALAGLAHDHVVATTRHVKLPTFRPGRLYTTAHEVFGDAMEPLLSTSVVRLRDGRRMVLSGADHPVAHIVAASSSVPGMVVPHRVGGHLYVDGGARSWISADLAPKAERLLVVAPGLAPSFGRFGVALKHHLGYEIRRWKQRTGGRVAVIRVDKDLGLRVTRWKHLFDAVLARDAYEQAREAVLRELAEGRLREFFTAWGPDLEL
jgi:predicted acylesterase/phospholipase RssA